MIFFYRRLATSNAVKICKKKKERKERVKKNEIVLERKASFPYRNCARFFQNGSPPFIAFERAI